MMPRESGQNRCLFVAVASLWHNKLTNLSASLFEIRGPMTGHWIHPPVSFSAFCVCACLWTSVCCPFRCCQSCRINNKRTRMLYSCQPKHSSKIAAAPLPSSFVHEIMGGQMTRRRLSSVAASLLSTALHKRVVYTSPKSCLPTRVSPSLPPYPCSGL